jgi:hypothetical protein
MDDVRPLPHRVRRYTATFRGTGRAHPFEAKCFFSLASTRSVVSLPSVERRLWREAAPRARFANVGDPSTTGGATTCGLGRFARPLTGLVFRLLGPPDHPNEPEHRRARQPHQEDGPEGEAAKERCPILARRRCTRRLGRADIAQFRHQRDRRQRAERRPEDEQPGRDTPVPHASRSLGGRPQEYLLSCLAKGSQPHDAWAGSRQESLAAEPDPGPPYPRRRLASWPGTPLRARASANASRSSAPT